MGPSTAIGGDTIIFLDMKEIQKVELRMPETLLTLFVDKKNLETVRSVYILLQKR